MIENSIESNRINGIIGVDEYLGLYNADELEKENTVLISMFDPSHNIHPDSKIQGFDDVLQMNFWDIDSDFGAYKTLTDEQGKEIRDFILKNKEKQFLIHCAAGVSRSAAVGCAVGTLLDNIKWEENEIQIHWRYDPNFAVYNKITGLDVRSIDV